MDVTFMPPIKEETNMGKSTRKGKDRPTSRRIKARLEYLRGEIEAERISYGELAELQSLAECIEPGDALLEWAGTPAEEELAAPLATAIAADAKLNIRQKTKER